MAQFITYMYVSSKQLAYFVKESEEILLLTSGSGSVAFLTCKLCIVTTDGGRGMG